MVRVSDVIKFYKYLTTIESAMSCWTLASFWVGAACLYICQRAQGL